MTKKELEMYQIYKNRVQKLNEDISNLESKDIDVVSDKVKGSMKYFPYTERRFSVEMEIPDETEKVSEQIAKKEKELDELGARMTEIEDFIDGMEDMQSKTIFEYRYIDGMSCYDIGEKLGYTKGRVSQIITNYLTKV